MIGLLCSWIPSSCIWPHKTGTRSSQSAFLHGGLGAHNHLLTAIDSWWFLGEEKSAFLLRMWPWQVKHTPVNGPIPWAAWIVFVGYKTRRYKIGSGCWSSILSVLFSLSSYSVCMPSFLFVSSQWFCLDFFFLNEAYDTQVYFSIKFFYCFRFSQHKLIFESNSTVLLWSLQASCW